MGKLDEEGVQTLTPGVELAGPAVILDDADLEQVIPIIMRGTYRCSQNCVGLGFLVTDPSTSS